MSSPKAYSAGSSYGGPDNVITGSHALVRHWSPTPSNINGGEKETPEDGTLTVLPGEIVTLSVTPATDEDTWTMAGVGSGTEPDTVSYAWSSGDGTFQNDTTNRIVQWQAPQDVGTYTVTATIDDAPAPVYSPDVGTRDDSPLIQNFTIKVAPKVWDTDLAIGNARQEDGTSIENGRMVLPQDQTSETPSPAHVKVFAGKTIDLSVEAATDSDHWKVEDTDHEGYDNDTVTYTWSATSGDIIGDANQRNAKWKAPMDAGTYTLTCTIDDTPKAIGAQEQGSRDDSAITRTVEVEVINGESSATLKLYKDDALTEEVDGDVGGTAYIVLEVKLGAGQHLVSNSATLRVEENYPQHSESERRWDTAINLSSGWQMKDANGDWQPSGSPQSTNATEDDEYFRMVWPWQTTTTPLGHNETHTIKLLNVDGGDDTELTFAPETGNGETKGPSGISADVKNLVITEAKAGDGNEDILIYDPESENSQQANPSVTFKFEDKDFQQGDTYFYQVFFPETHYGDSPAQIGNLSSVQPITVAFPKEDTQRGIYGFGLILQKNRPGTPTDTVWSRSRKRFFDATHIEINGDEDDPESKMQFHYRIIRKNDTTEPPKPLSKVTIKMFDGAYLSAGSVDGPKNVLNPEDPDHIVDIPDSGSDEPGEGRVVATGIDDEGDSYRNHQPKHLLPYNAVTKFYKVIFLNGPGVAHLNPKGGTTLLGWTNPGYLKRSLPNSSNKSKIFFTEFPTGSSPESIWNNIVAAGNRVRGRGQSHYLLVTTNTHASTGAISISQQLGGFWHHDDDNGNSVETASWVVQRSQSKLNDSVIGDLPDLVSVSSFLAIGCDSAQDVDPQDPHKTNGVTNDISMAMAFSKGANNAVGFSTYTYPAYGQLWYNCYYRYGTLAENSGSAQTALTAVTDVYAIKLSVFYPSVTLEDTGYNNWVAAYLSEPLLK